MNWLSMTPKILCDDADRLVVVESHLGRRSIVLTMLLLGCPFLVPAIENGLVALIIGLVLAILLVGFPFLVALAFSRYRGIEIRSHECLIASTFRRLGRSQVERTAWADIAQLICEHVPRTRDEGVDGLRLFLLTADGSRRQLLWGWHSDRLVTALHRHLGERFVPPVRTPETVR